MDSKPTPLPYAVTAFAVAALLEYPLAKRFPLQKPVPIGTRMATAGALAFVGTFAAFHIVSSLKGRPQLP